MTGAEALAELDKAEALSGTVPKAERLNILSMVADRRGDDRRVAELTTQLVELLPGDWRAHWYKGMRGRLARSAIHGQALPDAAGLDEVIASLKRAVELNPMAGAVHNQLGYLSLLRGRKDEAIAAFENYIRVAPNEPNAYDSLGDALLAANRLEDAEAQFKKALEVSPRFWQSWGGIAATRALRGDWKGAYDALNSSTQSAVRPQTSSRLRGSWAGHSSPKDMYVPLSTQPWRQRGRPKRCITRVASFPAGSMVLNSCSSRAVRKMR